MTVRNLDAVFRPKSAVVVGASRRPGSVGAIVWRRVVEGGFAGPLWAVNPKYADERELDGHPVLADVAALPAAPDIAVICTRPDTWPALVQALGGIGTRAAILVGEARGDAERAALARTLEAARPFLLRLVGPASLGVMTPARAAQLGAPARIARPGGVAWVSQSNALTNAVLAWADARDLGFSHVVALGDEADVDAGDVLDFLASDASTRAILLELDSVRAARKFMSAARAAARNKPVLALRSGRAEPVDALYTSAFRRAGMVRVDTLDDLLDEIETLGVGRVAASETATLITSDRGVAALAADAFASAGDQLARWDEPALAAVAAALPHAQAGNPLLLGDDAQPEHFSRALTALASHPSTGTAFVVHASTHNAPAEDVARALIEQRRYAYRGMLACFFGGVDVATRDALRAHGIAVHPTPLRLARAFARLVDYRIGREMLMQTPENIAPRGAVALDAAQADARAALAAGHTELDGAAAARLLERFGLHVLRAVGGGADKPLVDIAVEFFDDDNFGPVFRFNAPSLDGVSPPLHAYELPPLSPVLGRDVLGHTHYAQHLGIEALLEALIRLSQMVCELREVVGLKLALRVWPARGEHGQRIDVVAPRVALAATRSRFAIMPYPRRLEETFDFNGQHLTIRPIKPEDEEQHRVFVASMDPEDLRLRFFSSVRDLDHTQLARFTQIDYDREMALIATVDDADGKPRTLGVVRAVTDPDNDTAEFAVMVLSEQKGGGLGRLLMDKIIAYARSRGTRALVGEALRENGPMIALARACGFTVTSSTDDPTVVGFRLALA